MRKLGKTISGIAWTGLEKILVQGVAFVQGVILARLLTPADFGLTAMLGIFLVLGGVLSDSGLGTALVALAPETRSRGLERRALVWNVALALGIYGTLSVAAPFVADWFGHPVLKPLMWVMALSLVFSAFGIVPLAGLTRGGRFGHLAVVNAVSVVGSSVVAIVMAWRGAGVWSVAGLCVVQPVLRTALAWWVHGGETAGGDARAQTASDAAARDFGRLLRYGWKLMVSGVIHAVYFESFSLVVGKLWSPESVGLFVRGRRWAQLPVDVVNESVGRVALPQMASGRLTGKSFVLLNAALLWPGLAILGIRAPEIVRLVLGPQWTDCVPYLRILLIGQVFAPVINIVLTYLRASGHSEAILQADLVKKPLGILALVIGAHFGIEGLCWAVVAGEVIEITVDLCFVRRVMRRVARP